MESSRLAEADQALAALGVDEARITSILGAHRANGHTLAEIDAELASLAEGVAVVAAPPAPARRPPPPPPPAAAKAVAEEEEAAAGPATPFDDLELDDSFGSMPPPPAAATPSTPATSDGADEIADAPTRDLPQPDVAITEATTGSLPTVRSEPPPDSGLSVDALFDEALAATAPPAAEIVIGDEPAEPEEPVDDGPAVNVSEELAALLEGELDPREFDGQAAAAPAGESDLASVLEPDAGEDLDVSDVELIMDDDITTAGEEPQPSVAASAGPPPPPPSPSQAPPDDGTERKGFFRKMFGK